MRNVMGIERFLEEEKWGNGRRSRRRRRRGEKRGWMIHIWKGRRRVKMGFCRDMV